MPLGDIDTSEGVNVGAAAQDLFDNPEGLISEIFQVLEHTKSKSKSVISSPEKRDWHAVVPAYHRSLRGDLKDAIRVYVARLTAVFQEYEPEFIPQTVRFFEDRNLLRDHAKAAAELRRLFPEQDRVLIERLDELSDWPHFRKGIPTAEKAYNSVHEAFDLVDITRGYRNSRAHAAHVPASLHSAVTYLTLFLLYSYSAYGRSLEQITEN